MPLTLDAPALARPSTLLSAFAVEGAATPHPPRADGWTPERIRAFLHALAQCGVVEDAARAAGMSRQSAYAFRNSARGRAFDVAWRAALLLARRRIADELMSRALNGCVEVIVRDGEVWGERHRFDNRLTLAVLTRLDELTATSVHRTDGSPRRAAEDFDAYVDSVCEGGEAPARFLRALGELDYGSFNDPGIIARNLVRAGEIGTAGAGADAAAGAPTVAREVSTLSTSDAAECFHPDSEHGHKPLTGNENHGEDHLSQCR